LAVLIAIGGAGKEANDSSWSYLDIHPLRDRVMRR
jgi:hypothetical protein